MLFGLFETTDEKNRRLEREAAERAEAQLARAEAERKATRKAVSVLLVGTLIFGLAIRASILSGAAAEAQRREAQRILDQNNRVLAAEQRLLHARLNQASLTEAKTPIERTVPESELSTPNEPIPKTANDAADAVAEKTTSKPKATSSDTPATIRQEPSRGPTTSSDFSSTSDYSRPSAGPSRGRYKESEAEKAYERATGKEVVHKKDGSTYERSQRSKK